jgi:hypothetical protein
MLMSDDTLRSLPTPKRPENGFLAWQATIGYISTEHSPDALLTLNVSPLENGEIAWRATASWGRFAEEVRDAPSLIEALRALWREVDRHHIIFRSLEAAVKKPINYKDDQWIDTDTQASLDRVIQIAQRAFGNDWRIVIVYQPVANPSSRVQARLIARKDTINSGGRGATLREACQLLYRNAANDFKG